MITFIRQTKVEYKRHKHKDSKPHIYFKVVNEIASRFYIRNGHAPMAYTYRENIPLTPNRT